MFIQISKANSWNNLFLLTIVLLLFSDSVPFSVGDEENEENRGKGILNVGGNGITWLLCLVHVEKYQCCYIC